MPIYSTRPSSLLPFLNSLEERIETMQPSVEEWTINQGKIMDNISKIKNVDFKASSAIGKSGMAMAEIGNATLGINARMPNRLRALIESLRAEMSEFAKTGGGGGAYDERINSEIDNAIASVDATVEDGLKLDYRLRKLNDLAMIGKMTSEKDVVFPYKHTITGLDSMAALVPEQEGVIFMSGEITVLDATLNPILLDDGTLLQGTIDETGVIALNANPKQDVNVYFPVEMDFIDIPKDFLMTMLQMLVEKSSESMRKIINFKSDVNDIRDILKKMQGLNWTEEFDIMRNHREIVQESITPSGLQVEVKNGMAHASFSYNDHPYLSHFILEKWDEGTNTWVPYNGTDGIITK